MVSDRQIAGMCGIYPYTHGWVRIYTSMLSSSVECISPHCSSHETNACDLSFGYDIVTCPTTHVMSWQCKSCTLKILWETYVTEAPNRLYLWVPAKMTYLTIPSNESQSIEMWQTAAFPMSGRLSDFVHFLIDVSHHTVYHRSTLEMELAFLTNCLTSDIVSHTYVMKTTM